VGIVKKAIADAAVGASSVAEAFIIAKSTADHSADEHTLEALNATAEAVAGVGINIYVMDMNKLPARAYGVWSVGWRWA